MSTLLVTGKENQIKGNNELVYSGVLDEKKLRGKWKLTYEIKNSLKANGFGSVGLSTYLHPITRRYLFPVIDGQPKAFLEFGSPIKMYDPDENANDRSIVNWLLNHPRVGIEGVDLDESIKKHKDSNPDFKLVNVDLQDLTEIEEENIIDEMVGRLTYEGGKHAVGLERLKYILAKLGMSFEDRRAIQSPQVLKKILRNKVKSFVKKSAENAQTVKKILDNIEEAKKHYAIRFLTQKGAIIMSNGMLKFEGIILGMNVESAVAFLEQNPDVWLIIQNKTSDYVREE